MKSAEVEAEEREPGNEVVSTEGAWKSHTSTVS